jgi:hypothetical protein
MTPKEKAKELVEKIESRAMIHDCFGSEYLVAKECALIAAREIVDTLYEYHYDSASGAYEYWTEVKQEIEAL